MRRLVPLLALAALPAAAQAQTATPPQYVGDPVTYLVIGQPPTALTTVLRVNEPLPAGSQLVAQTAGGDVLGTATLKAAGKQRLCYRASFSLDAPVSAAGTITVVLTAGADQLQPNAELIRLYAPKKVPSIQRLTGGAAC